MNILCFLPALFEVSFAGGGVATSAGVTSVELEDFLVNPSVNG